MVHDESHLILWRGMEDSFIIGMFLLECDCEMVSGHCMCT